MMETNVTSITALVIVMSTNTVIVFGKPDNTRTGKSMNKER